MQLPLEERVSSLQTAADRHEQTLARLVSIAENHGQLLGRPVDMDHTALVNEARESGEKLGYKVFTEDQNFFTLRGKAATLAGKPDLIAVKVNDLVIVDAKTGKPNPAHSIQVLTYMYAVPRALPEYKGMEFRGHILYPDSKVQIPVSGPGRQFIDRLGALVRRLADENPARKVSSASECRWYNHWGRSP